MSHRRRREAGWGMVWLVSLAMTAGALAGGTPEHALILVDPTNPDSMYLANYYHQKRDIPASNFLYMYPAASDYNTFIAENLDAVFGQLADHALGDHIDYIIIAPTDVFYINAPNTISDTCFPVNRFSLTAAYTLAYDTNRILNGLPSTSPNEYFKNNNGARAFSNATTWKDGLPDTSSGARRYFLGAQLGYTGLRGNTVSELTALMDRTAAVDGTFPGGTFYYCKTTDAARSGPRDGDYPARVADLIALGANAVELMANLPNNATDVLGIMTGLANPDIAGANMTILPSAFCDHLTSFAAKFDAASQVKVSAWIANGAAGSWGTVEEPCNYPQKFPNPRIHIFYFKGLPLGDAVFRSIAAMPFQGMLYGDPLTRPFTYIPQVSVPDAPTGTVSGTIVLSPSGTTPNPNANVIQFDLYIDGVLTDSIGTGAQFTVDTTTLADGWHDLRVLGSDGTLRVATGRWLGSMTTSNHGHSISATPLVTSGDLSTAFPIDISASGSGISEVRLTHNGRVVAAAAGSAATLTVSGLMLGAGAPEVIAEALLSDGSVVRSDPVTLTVAFTGGTPSGAAPGAFSYTRFVDPNIPTTLIELPADYDDNTDPLSYTIVSGPAQATVSGAGAWNYVFLKPNAGAAGTDTLEFEVTASNGTSNTATVTIVYSLPCPGDVDGDNTVNVTDLGILLGNFGTASGAQRSDGDLDGDGDVDVSDLGLLLGNFGSSCV